MDKNQKTSMQIIDDYIFISYINSTIPTTDYLIQHLCCDHIKITLVKSHYISCSDRVALFSSGACLLPNLLTYWME